MSSRLIKTVSAFLIVVLIVFEFPYISTRVNAMSNTYAGQKCGTEGQSLRIEAIEIRFTGELADYYSVEYCVHIQDYGDMQGWVKDGALAGTTGESKRIEELKIRIVPKNFGSSMSVKYRVHAQDIGWMAWATKNGECTGTAGRSARLEGIQIVLVPKGEPAPGATYEGITAVTDKAFVEGF